MVTNAVLSLSVAQTTYATEYLLPLPPRGENKVNDGAS